VDGERRLKRVKIAVQAAAMAGMAASGWMITEVPDYDDVGSIRFEPLSNGIVVWQGAPLTRSVVDRPSGFAVLRSA